MSDSREFEFEGAATPSEAADALNRIADGIRARSLSLSMGDEAITVFPDGDLSLEIEASDKKGEDGDRHRVDARPRRRGGRRLTRSRFEVRWRASRAPGSPRPRFTGSRPAGSFSRTTACSLGRGTPACRPEPTPRRARFT
jgi:amphi-Trp domain-containing protein